MSNKHFLSYLEENNVFLDLPSQISFRMEGTTLVMVLSKKSILDNMHTDAAAFESWAILLKCNLYDKIDRVLISVGDNFSVDKDSLHYNRFLYRLDKFIKTYEWASTDHKISLDFSDIVCNFPKQDAAKAEEWKQKDGEHVIECRFVEEKKSNYDILDHQLPVGLFHGNVSRTTHFTPGNLSQIDIWAVKNNEIYIFELKKPQNKPAGIISELMFYVNVIDDILRHQIQYVPTKDLHKSIKKNFRGFGDFYRIYQSGEIRKIHAVFLADNLHSQITQNVINLINSSARYKYSNIEFSWQKINE